MNFLITTDLYTVHPITHSSVSFENSYIPFIHKVPKIKHQGKLCNNLIIFFIPDKQTRWKKNWTKSYGKTINARLLKAPPQSLILKK